MSAGHELGPIVEFEATLLANTRTLKPTIVEVCTAFQQVGGGTQRATEEWPDRDNAIAKIDDTYTVMMTADAKLRRIS